MRPQRERRRSCTAGPRRAASTPYRGLVIGVAQAATPLAFWWLDTATVYALRLVLIASVYIGFAVADGRGTVLAVKSGVAGMFVIVAAAAITSTRWLLVAGLAGHGLKDLWQHRRQFVCQHTLVASLLSRGRLDGRSDHRRRDRRRRAFPPLELSIERPHARQTRWSNVLADTNRTVASGLTIEAGGFLSRQTPSGSQQVSRRSRKKRDTL